MKTKINISTETKVAVVNFDRNRSINRYVKKHFKGKVLRSMIRDVKQKAILLIAFVTTYSTVVSQIPHFDYKYGVKFDGIAVSEFPDFVGVNQANFIKNKLTQKVLTIQSTNENVTQADLAGTIFQKFIFEKTEEIGVYFIRELTDGLFVTLRFENENYIIKREPKKSDIELGSQQWIFKRATESNCFTITNKLYPIYQLAADNNNSISEDNKKWVLKRTSLEDNPRVNDADKGLVMDCEATIPADFMWVVDFSKNQNIATLFPEWRAVGDDQPRTTPMFSYRTVEGVVSKNELFVNYEDFPLSHYTHDVNFRITPDPAFNYLLANQSGIIQNEIEVEWETGLGANDNANNNPAVPLNKVGKSFGFYSAGHEQRKVIWNWPTINDWVHV
jgi:hypothetical protein